MENENFLERNNSGIWTISIKRTRQEKKESKRTRQKTGGRDRKGESHGSPEIPDRRTSDIPGLLLGL